MPVTTYQNLPLADRNRSWDGPAAKKRIKSWATTDGETDWQKYRRGFLWYDSEKAEAEGGYKMLFADVIGGELKAVPKGVFAAASVLQGGRGGANIPSADVSKCKTHLNKYYAKMRKEWGDENMKAPWEKKELELPTRHVRAEIPMEDVEVREVEAEGDDSVEFEGYGLRWNDEATIGFFFRFTEKFQKGAFKKTISERGPGGNGQIKFLRQHNDRQSVAAKILELKEDATGLWFKARTIGTEVGKDLAVELREGVVDTLSIGFDVIQENINKDQEPILRTVIEARLYEISAVLWPAYASATVEAVRALDGGALDQFIALLEQEVREGKVLSQTNRTRLEEARGRIDDVLGSAGEPEHDDGSEDGNDNDSPDPPDDEDRDATLDLELSLRQRELELTNL